MTSRGIQHLLFVWFWFGKLTADIFFSGASTPLIFPDLNKIYQTADYEKSTEGQIINVNHLHLLTFVIFAKILLSFSAILLFISDQLVFTKPPPTKDFPLSQIILILPYELYNCMSESFLSSNSHLIICWISPLSLSWVVTPVPPLCLPVCQCQCLPHFFVFIILFSLSACVSRCLSRLTCVRHSESIKTKDCARLCVSPCVWKAKCRGGNFTQGSFFQIGQATFYWHLPASLPPITSVSHVFLLSITLCLFVFLSLRLFLAYSRCFPVCLDLPSHPHSHTCTLIHTPPSFLFLRGVDWSGSGWFMSMNSVTPLPPVHWTRTTKGR